MPDLKLKPTVGLVPGETIQFALGRWQDAIGSGVALSEEAFDRVEPHLRSVWPEWKPELRYGAAELPQPIVSTLAQRLRSESEQMSSEAELFRQLADWLDAHCDGPEPVSILGI